jgi:uncharacterized oxidoreductase
MHTKGNTILITGGGTGIGLGLARAFHHLGNHVIIAGRRSRALHDAAKKTPGLATYVLDVQRPGEEMRSFAEKLLGDFPDLNMLINNAGVMKAENLLGQHDWAGMEAMVATNLLGPMRLTAALLPSLLERPHAAIINVSSGLGFVPLATAPTYCATKAALHSYTESLRHQLRHTKVRVVELIPPYVATHLMDGANDPNAMPLDAYIEEVMEIIKSQPRSAEICVERAKRLRLAGEAINYEKVFHGMNGGRAASTPADAPAQ